MRPRRLQRLRWQRLRSPPRLQRLRSSLQRLQRLRRLRRLWRLWRLRRLRRVVFFGGWFQRLRFVISRAMRRGGSRRILRSCRSYSKRPKQGVKQGVRRLTRQANRILKPISAGVARPYMPDVIVRQMLGPFRRNDIRTTPRTLISKCSVHGHLLGFRPFLS